jgi:signal transduction histidine kinase
VTEPDLAAADDRVVLLAPTRRDEVTTVTLLAAAGFHVTTCTTITAAAEELHAGAAVLIVPEEMLTPDGRVHLVQVLECQPRWSDLPVLVLTRTGASSAASSEAAQTLGNVTLLERPLRLTTFLSAVKTAVRARQRQYEIKRFLEERAANEDSLRRADERKDEFLATLGHELRNPLAPLLSGVHLMRLLIPEDERVLRVASTMERQISHLVRLVDDLLEVSRITRGLVEVRHDPLDLSAILHEAVDSTRPTFDRARHELAIDIPVGPIPVIGDRVRLTQVFSNLLTNAAKYTNEGGRIRLSAAHTAARVTVTITDNGIGIPASHLASVFDMFTQVDRSSRRAQGGLGIGLTLVRSLVDLHGGRVEARSAGPGQGSEFIVDLPLHVASLGAADQSAPARTLPNRRVLVVDDNQDAAAMLAALLEALGATVAIAHSGRAALAQFETFTPDAVVLDIGMPEMDGYEVARQLRGRPERAATLLIALTGWGQERDLRQSQAAGFDHHLVKPPDIDKLRELLRAG